MGEREFSLFQVNEKSYVSYTCNGVGSQMYIAMFSGMYYWYVKIPLGERQINVNFVVLSYQISYVSSTCKGVGSQMYIAMFSDMYYQYINIRVPFSEGRRNVNSSCFE